MHVTWEPASSLPPAAILEFERGQGSEVVQTVNTEFGHEISTIHVVHQPQTLSSSPATKKAKKDRHVIEDTNGCV